MLFLGLDGVGKTTILYRLHLDQVVAAIPTIGFNVEKVTINNEKVYDVWDVGSRDKARPLWRHYYPNTHAFVYVIDGTDKERVEEALDGLIDYCLNVDETRNTVVMILVNKADKEGALSCEDIEKR